MKKVILCVLIVLLTATPVFAVEYTPPQAPEAAQDYMPPETENFADGLRYIIRQGIKKLQPHLAEGIRVCLSLVAIVLFASIMKGFSGTVGRTVELTTTLAIAALLVQSANSMIQLGVKTVQEICEYGKLLLPVITAALAAQGGTTTSAALYTGTAFFNTVLSTAVSKLIIPMLYVFLVLCIAHRAIGEMLLKNLRDFLNWLIGWSIKLVLYIFTGYLGVTGVVSGAADAAALKVTRMAIAGAVPVVGGIISDASESILVSMGMVKGAVGIYGLLAVLAVWIGPFLQIGLQYILLKLTAALCGTFGTKESVELINDFSAVMGFLVAMTSIASLLLLISIVCFLKGVG